jgi:hypothetical protein
MNLYLVESIEGVGYDEYDGFVVRARSASLARKMAQAECVNYQTEVFTDPEKSKLTLLASNAPYDAGIVLSSFNAG